jgi:hypothetical protein
MASAAFVFSGWSMGDASLGSATRDGRSWPILVAGGDAEPLWSKRIHASENDARRDAWHVLVMYEGPNEVEQS